MKVIILGGGPGGNDAARRALDLGHEIIIVEESLFGGTCTNRGCIPTKFLLSAVKQHLPPRGELIDPGAWKKIQARKKALVNGLSRRIKQDLEEGGARVHRGRGSLSGPGEVTVAGEGGEITTLKGDAVSSTLNIPVFNIDGERVLTSDEALELPEVPRSMIVVGSGPVGAEFSLLLTRMGVEVTLLEALPHLLPLEDEDVGAVIQKEFGRLGIRTVTGARVISTEVAADGVTVRLEDGRSLTAEKALVSIGRSLNTRGIGLEESGVDTDGQGAVVVDGCMETSLGGVYAVGDITGKHMLAHVASAQGVAAVESISGGGRPMNYESIPWAVFVAPEVATVGLNEKGALAADLEHLTGKAAWTGNIKARIDREQQGFIKIVAEKETGRLLGGTIVGPRASEMIHTLGLAMRGKLTADEFSRCIFLHPSLSESFQEAARSLS